MEKKIENKTYKQIKLHFPKRKPFCSYIEIK